MTKKKQHLKSYLLACIGIGIGILLDQYTKMLAVKHLKNQSSIDIIENVFQLHYLENKGAAFGMLQNQKLFFIITTSIVLVLICLFYINMPHTKRLIPLRLCLIGIAAGAVGNFIDRIRLNYVVDFLYFELIDFPVFNVADIYVTLSAIGLILLILFYYKEDDLEALFRFFPPKVRPDQKEKL